jgi:hypothetical protein
MIRDAQGKLAITPGAWEVANRAAVGNQEGEHVANCSWANEAYCNAALIAEAGTVTNATGRTPAELAELVRGFKNACLQMIDCLSCAFDKHTEAYLEAKHWIDKSEGV